MRHRYSFTAPNNVIVTMTAGCEGGLSTFNAVMGVYPDDWVSGQACLIGSIDGGKPVAQTLGESQATSILKLTPFHECHLKLNLSLSLTHVMLFLLSFTHVMDNCGCRISQ